MWNHLGMGTASALIVPTDVHGCHLKHLACVTVHGCDVAVIFLIQGIQIIIHVVWICGMDEKKNPPRNSCPRGQFVKQSPPPFRIHKAYRVILYLSWLLCLIVEEQTHTSRLVCTGLLM